MADEETRKLVDGVIKGVGVEPTDTLRDRVEATELWFVLHRPSGRAWGRRGQFPAPVVLGKTATATGAFDMADFARSHEEAAAIAEHHLDAGDLPDDHNIVSIRVRVPGMTIIKDRQED
jgi:hypothetical protein